MPTPKFQRRHSIAVAEVVRTCIKQELLGDDIMKAFLEMFLEDNENFDSGEFMDTCEPFPRPLPFDHC